MWDRTRSGRRRNCLPTLWPHLVPPNLKHPLGTPRHVSQIGSTLATKVSKPLLRRRSTRTPPPQQSLGPLNLMCLKPPLPRPVSAQSEAFSPPLLPSVSCRKTEESFAHSLMSKRMWFLHGRFILVSLAFREIASE